MSKTYLTIGCTPSGESCVQVSQTVDYMSDMMSECRKFKDMLIAKFPNCKEVQFGIKKFEHDFGTYAEVVVYYDENNSISEAQAFFIEDNIPTHWNDTDILEFNISETDSEIACKTYEIEIEPDDEGGIYVYLK